MARSGTFNSGRYVNQYGPWLTLYWNEIRQDVANNRTLVRLRLRFHWDAPGGINYIFHNRSGRLQGASYTFSGTASGKSGYLTLRTRDVWVSHNSNGERAIDFSGDIRNLGLYWSGTNIGTMSVSGRATLTPIPRASKLTAFSFASHLKPDTAVTINYTVDRKHSGFRHQIQLRDGGTTIRQWDNISSDGSSTLSLDSSYVNTLLKRMSNTTSKSLTLRVATRSGVNGSWIGSAVTRNAKANVHSNVKPSVSNLSISQEGNDITDDYLQSISRVKAEFSASAGYGARLSTRTIIVRKVGGSNSQSISGSSGTTNNPIASSGTYEVIATARDSRGRTSDQLRTTFTATAYNQPTINKFSVSRQEDAQAVVDILRSGSWTSLDGQNTLDISIQRKQGDGDWESVENTTETTGSFSRAFTHPNNDVTLSYDYRLLIVDQFGNSAESSASISTQRVVLDVHKNEGVGIGKIHERGVLDVDGDVYINGFKNRFVTTPQGETPKDLNDITISGAYRLEDRNAMGVANYPDHPGISWGQMLNIRGGSDTNVQMAFPRNDARAFFLRTGTGATDSVFGNPINWQPYHSIESGINANGDWIRFGDGMMICFGASPSTTTVWGWNFPQAFKTGTLPKVVSLTTGDSTTWQETKTQSHVRLRASGAYYQQAIAIGRWK